MADDKGKQSSRFVTDNTPGDDNNTMTKTGLRTHRNVTKKADFSPAALQGLSDIRKAQIETVTEGRSFSKTGDANHGVVGVLSNPKRKMEAEIKRAMDLTPSLTKAADFSASFLTGTSGPSSSIRGIDRAIPEIYSPLFQVANLNLPRDRMTMNAWNRNFYDTHPVVRNAITLHSTYPISKINVKCKHRKVEQFFNDMAERIDLFDVIAGVAFEFWKLGEAFPYAELDESAGIWKSIVVQNPDYVTVKKSGVSTTPVISLRPDEQLKKIVTSNHPADIKLRSQIPDNIIHHIRKNEPIPLDNFNISHLKMLSSPYDLRGTSIIVSCYKDLMLYDKLRECFQALTQVLTDQGFKNYNDVIIQNSDGTVKPDPAFKIACYNTDNKHIEYHSAIDAILRDYKGKVKHFQGEKVDLTVTPGHRMYIKTTGKKNGKTHWKDYYFTEAKNITSKTYCKFKSSAKYVSELEPKVVAIGERLVDTELFLRFLGYVVSEGCVYVNTKNGRYDRTVTINQYLSSKHYEQMRTTMEKVAAIFERPLSSYVRMNSTGYAENNPGEQWNGTISSKELTLYLKEQIGVDNNTKSHFKHLPRWVLELSPRLLKILLDALVAGDGGQYESKYDTGSVGYRYSTVSKQLADDVYELVYKCGFVPTLSVVEHKYEDRDNVVEYLVLWSDTAYGDEPIVYGHPDHNGAKVYDEDYDGKIWCLTVPTGAMIVRQNGKISIQGNCQFAQADSLINPITLVKVGGTGEAEYHPTAADLEAWKDTLEAGQWDKDYKIISHAGVTIERVGASGQIVDTQNMFTFIRENLYAGLMVPKAIMDTEGTAYASASIGLEVLRTRYITFRNMLEKWLEKKIFAPISQLQGFFEYHGGEKVLIVPEIDWNHINLYDLNDYIQALGNYVDKNRISIHTLYRSLGLNWEDEQKNIREEMIQAAVIKKEAAQLDQMTLVELRALTPDEQIVEEAGEQEPLPGQAPQAEPGAEGMPDLAGPPSGGPPGEGAPSAPPTEEAPAAPPPPAGGGGGGGGGKPPG